jgi:two-component system, chemotaxis family, protein-glutamate methylesterase/glutaminase
MKDKIRVLVVDDSPYNRKVITEILESSDRIEVVAKAFDGEDAIRKIVAWNPDLITLDLEMPGMDGFAVLRWLMANRPVPVLVVSSRESNRSVFKALDLGAVDFVVKPSRSASPRLKELEQELLSKVLSIPSLHFERIKERVMQAPKIDFPPLMPLPKGEHSAEIIAIAASTGGPPAVQFVLSHLPKNLLTPILICQHMPPIFTSLFAERLSAVTKKRVKEAADGDELLPQSIFVAPGGKQMSIMCEGNRNFIRLAEKSPEDRFAPSANYLFRSVADHFGKNSVAVILTGMGDDGKEGAMAVHSAGGKVIAESEKSAVIFGMPREVARSGAADSILGLEEIPDYIARWGIFGTEQLQ